MPVELPAGNNLLGGLSEQLIAWCTERFRSPPARVLFRDGNLSRVTGLRLRDGRHLVIKVRPAAPRHRGCTAVQGWLSAAGYPAPEPLAGPDRIGDDDVTAERLVTGGLMLRDAEPAADLFAAALARLVRLAPALSVVPSLDPVPPWARWDHDQSGTWPAPVAGTTDLNDGVGPRWLDQVAARARIRLVADRGRPVVGHVDFESQNVRWRGRQLSCVHDWDSAAVRSEAAIAGLASAVFPAIGRAPATATVAGSRRFLSAYAEARGRPWRPEEEQVAWAAGVWVLAYNARVELTEGRSRLAERLAADAESRLALAGI